jgi:GAF domain-containing protein
MDSNWLEDLARAATDMAHQPDPEHTLQRIRDHACRFTAADDAGILRTRAGGALTLALANSDAVRSVEELQLAGKAGPGVDLIKSSISLRVDDTRTDPRWPSWGAAAAELGWHSVLSVRLSSRTRALGSVTLYSGRYHAFDDDAVRIAELFAQYASIALASSVEQEGLHRAIDARHLIGQAQGVLMERYDIDANRAFTVLQRYSQDHNIKLRQVAQHILDHRHLPDAEQPTHAMF